MKRVTLFALTFCLLCSPLLLPMLLPSRAQVSELREEQGAAAAWRALLRLRSTVTVLHTTAHPDDEDAALLTWLARGAAVRTGLLTLTRGEGGANLIGAEQYDALGVLRTEELLAAGRHYGLDAQIFTRAVDFGFSKRLDETLEHWGKETVLRDVVRGIRSYRPDIIISRFHGKARDGHGNHQAAGLLTLEAFKAAADPTVFPDQFREGVRPWQVKKLYLSVRESEPSSLKIDVGAYDPLLGRSYRELAADGYRMHRSQAIGLGRTAPGQAFSSVQLIESTLGKGTEKALFDKLDNTILGLAKVAGTAQFNSELADINRAIEVSISKFDARQPWLIANDLAAGARSLRTLITKVKEASLAEDAKDHLLFLLNNKDREFTDAMNKALGLVLEVLADPPTTAGGGGFMQARESFRVAIPGQQFTLTYSLVNRSPVKLSNTEYLLQTPPTWETRSGKFDEITKAENKAQRMQFTVTVPPDAQPTRLYWSRQSEIRDHLYSVKSAVFLSQPFPAPEVLGWFYYEVGGVKFTLSQPVQTVYVERPYGEQRRQLVVAPALSIELAPRVGVVNSAAQAAPLPVTVSLLNNVKGSATGKVRLRLPTGWQAQPAEQTFSFSREGDRANFSFSVQPGALGGQSAQVQAVAEYQGREYTEGYQIIAARDLEPRHLYRPATLEVRSLNVQVPANLHVGYVMGVGDEMPRALEQLGVKVTMLNAQDLATGSFDSFDAVLIGIRATAVRSDLQAYYRRLLDYAERGGHLIYQYQTPEFDDAPYGPFPYKLTPRAEEVSEEDAKVTVLAPQHPFFTWPNPISEADFADWVEERGSKWMTTWDARYQPLLESHDREQPPQRGGLMFAPYGKGAFTYAAYAFYRQLPAGVPGGYRLFTNLLSWKKRPQ